MSIETVTTTRHVRKWLGRRTTKRQLCTEVREDGLTVRRYCGRLRHVRATFHFIPSPMKWLVIFLLVEKTVMLTLLTLGLTGVLR